jgi:murein DD-endopeptidase MepM/ murein hydrolase activator NlpD
LILRSFLASVCLFLPATIAQALSLQFSGDLMQGGLAWTRVPPNAQVWLDKQQVPVLPDGRVLLGFHRDEPAEVTLTVRTADSQVTSKRLSIVQRKYKIQRINGLAKNKVKAPPDPAIQARISRENAEVKSARAVITPYPLFDTGFIWPARGKKTGVYGSQRILNGKPSRPHYGVDVAAPRGTRVIAPADGIVRLVQGDNYYSGGTIILDHGYGLSSSFLHLQSFNVTVGQAVRQGTMIGTIGSTGRSTGPHLDWRMNWFGKRIDPEPLIRDKLLPY